MTVCALWLFTAHVPWVGLQCVIVVFPDHTHLLLVLDGDAQNISFGNLSQRGKLNNNFSDK